jgi:hypothetical protein
LPYQKTNSPASLTRSGLVQQVAGANRRWRLQFRYRGSRHESAVAQLFTLLWLLFGQGVK